MNRFCPGCQENKPLVDYNIRKSGPQKGTPRHICKKCQNDYDSAYRLKCGIRPTSEAKDSSSYLGIYIAERALSNFFDTIIRMPPNNPGYDFLCGKGFKIDVKSSCLRIKPNRSPFWQFNTKHNKKADYFLFMGLDNRDSLKPMRIWLIPNDIADKYNAITISNIDKSIAKWIKYEKPLDRVISCCSQIRARA